LVQQYQSPPYLPLDSQKLMLLSSSSPTIERVHLKLSFLHQNLKTGISTMLSTLQPAKLWVFLVPPLQTDVRYYHHDLCPFGF
jgi:hypothetical protein